MASISERFAYALAAAKLTPEERQLVRNFLVGLAGRHPNGWEGLMMDAGVAPSTAHDWRYGQEPGTPSSVNLLKVLRAAEALQSFAVEELVKAQRAAADSVAAAMRLKRRTQDGRGRGASNG